MSFAHGLQPEFRFPNGLYGLYCNQTDQYSFLHIGRVTCTAGLQSLTTSGQDYVLTA